MKSKLTFLTALTACLAFAAALFFADVQQSVAGPPGPHPGGGGGPRPAAPRPSAPRPSAPRPSAPRPSRPTPNVRPSTPHTPHPGNMGHPSGPGKINPGHPSTGTKFLRISQELWGHAPPEIWRLSASVVSVQSHLTESPLAGKLNPTWSEAG